MCVLDDRSGAAIEVRGMLKALAKAGWDAHAIQTTRFDGQAPYPLERLLDPASLVPENRGRMFRFRAEGVEHRLFYAATAHEGGGIDPDEEYRFRERALAALEHIRPDVVLTYGGSRFTRELLEAARALCTRRVFFLANESYADGGSAEYLRGFDRIVVPSAFMRDYYRERVGLHCQVQRSLLDERYRVAPRQVRAVHEPERRGEGFVTIINPALEKGLLLFARLAAMARRERPDWRFLAVEGRRGREVWERTGGLDNVRWLDNQADIRPVYARTSVLLFPSFWEEAAGRSIVEAQLAGIPVLAANHGGIPEQLNGGGFRFDIPERCRSDYAAMPTEDEVRPWFHRLERLMDDGEAYIEASVRARRAAEAFRPERVEAEVVRQFESVLGRSTAWERR